jgi:ESCRT-II complex subunit VPS25
MHAWNRLQPVAETREKQLRLWRELILQSCASTNTFTINPTSFTIFSNPNIDRRLSPEGINAVIEYLIKSGHGEWQDNSLSTLRVMWKSPEALGNEIYSWASTVEILGTVFTIYEIHSGEEYADSGFHGTDPWLVRRALQYLESINKVSLLMFWVAYYALFNDQAKSRYV